MAVSEGAPVFEAAVPCEVFGIDRPELVSPWYQFDAVPVGGANVRLAFGFRLPLEGSRVALEAADTLVVPSCASVHDEPPAELVESVRAAYDRGARVLSICSGAFVLAAAGILDGRRATTHWMHASELARRYPLVEVDPRVLYTEDKNVITSAGTAAAIDACLHLVRLDHGAKVAAELARRLVTPPHREGGQSQYVRSAEPPLDDWLAPLLEWTSTQLHQPLTTREMARCAGVSVRTLERRFAATLASSPLQWLLQQRVRRAQQLLETTDRPIEWVATTSGLGTPANLRVHFNRLVGVPPSAYRRTFQHPEMTGNGAGSSIGRPDAGSVGVAFSREE
ncbi:helix-turn-helix domain-containing protein [Streptomyces sp. NPDC056697]